MKSTLWPRQEAAITSLRQTIGQGITRVVLQSPTGSGKTKIAAKIVDGALRKDKRVAFVVPQIDLVDQAVQEFYGEGIMDIGVIQADHHMTDWSKPVQVCSIQTITSRGKYPEASIVIPDEVHIWHETHARWIHDPQWANVPFIGLSATPWRKGLGHHFQTMITVATTQELIDEGFLSDFRVFATGHPDLTGVRTIAGDYHEGELSAAMQKGDLTADIVRTWRDRWGKGKTFVFGVDRAHAKALQQRFRDIGVSAGYQDAFTPISERKQLKQDFHDGSVDVLCNVGTLTTGVDYDVRCLVLARPTKSEMLYVQIIGRALRTADGKDYALILDHSDTTARLGFVTDIYHDRLDDGREKTKPERSVPLPKPCPKCDCMLPRINSKCQNCGFIMPPHVCEVVERDGQLLEIDRQAKTVKRKAAASMTLEEKARFFAGLKFIAAEKGYKPGWAAYAYKQKLKVWPDWRIADMAPLEPTMEVRQWVKYLQIRRARGAKKEGPQPAALSAS